MQSMDRRVMCATRRRVVWGAQPNNPPPLLPPPPTYVRPPKPPAAAAAAAANLRAPPALPQQFRHFYVPLALGFEERCHAVL